MLENKCCLYVIIPIRLFSITICNLFIDFPSYFDWQATLPAYVSSTDNMPTST